MWFNTTERITSFLSLKSLIKTTQNTKPKQTRKALSLFCKLISPEEIRESKSEQRRCYSFIADPAASPDCSEYWISVANGGRENEAKFLHEDRVSYCHPLFSHSWMTSCVKDLRPRKALSAGRVTAIFFLRQSWNFQPESKISLQSL